MKKYSSIPSIVDGTIRVMTFDKIDGSLVRAEWSRKRSCFYKFGSRDTLIDRNSGIIGKSVELISSFNEPLRYALESFDSDSVICFFEFVGTKSFAGNHVHDDDHRVVLLDVAPLKKDIVSPEAFVKTFSGLIETPRILHTGTFTYDVELAVRDGSLAGMTFEGVVCKQLDGYSTFKVKNGAWLAKLRKKCGDDEALYDKLA